MIDYNRMFMELESQVDALEPPERQHMLKYIDHIKKEIEEVVDGKDIL